MTPDELEHFLQEDRWFDSRGHAWILYGIARAMARVRKGIVALEIGVREGSTTIPLLAGMIAGHPTSLLVSIDNNTDIVPDTPQRAQRRVQELGFASHWEFHSADSHSWQSPYDGYDLIFIDGDHSYDGVKMDFERFSSLLRQHGIITMHDTECYPDCWKFVNELASNPDWQVATLPFYNGLSIVRRRSDTRNYSDHFTYVEDFGW